MRILCVCLGLTLLGLSLPGGGGAAARPVSYQGGLTLIIEQDQDMRAGLLHFTPHPRASIGWRHERHDDAGIDVDAVQGTLLVKRWLGPDHQANIYLSGAVGTANGPSGSAPAAIAGVMADWETRRYFVGYRARAADFGDAVAPAGGRDAMQALRLGVAPYIGDTGALHSWVMIDIAHRPEADDTVRLTPMLRFFKGPALLEFGWGLDDGAPTGAFIYRF